MFVHLNFKLYDLYIRCFKVYGTVIITMHLMASSS